MKIKLPIIYEPEDDEISDILEKDIPLEDCELRTVVFYSISAIAPYYYKGREFARIYSGSQDFLCQYTVEKVEKIIDRYGN